MEFQNLQSLLNRATAPNSEEEAKHYCTRFTTLVNLEPDGASRAITLLIAKVQSQNEPVALRAIHVMDQCTKHCGKSFQCQIGKFRFLNELIKLVSTKYAGSQTAVSVRSAIVQQLKLWSTTYKDQTKIIEAYNMLDKTGNTKIKIAQREFSYAAGEDADKAALLAQLLKSKNKQDLETANQMIKDMVAAEGRKIEQDTELLRDVMLIHNNGRLLSEMLANTDRSADDKLLLDELHKTCVGLRPKLYRLAGQLSDSAQLSSVVEAGETLNRAIEQYEMLGCGDGGPQIAAYQPPTISQQASTVVQPQPVADLESTTLINLEEENTNTKQTMSADDFDHFMEAAMGNTDASSSAAQPIISIPDPVMTPNITTAESSGLVSSNGVVETSSSGLFGGMTLQPQPTQSVQPVAQPTSQPILPTQQVSNNDDFASALGLLSFDTQQTSVSNKSLLDDIFSTPANAMTSGDVLQPISTVSAKPVVNKTNTVVDTPPLHTFDLLIPEITGGAFPSPKPKPTLAQLQAASPQPVRAASPLAAAQPARAASPLAAARPARAASPLAAAQPARVGSPLAAAQPARVGSPLAARAASPSLLTAPVPHPRDVLADVNVPLTLIRPTPVPPMLVYDSVTIRVSLYQTDNKPEPSVAVWLITVTNSSPTAIEEVALEMKVSGAGQLKLTPPTTNRLSPFSPICPVSPIQQVLVTTDCKKLDYVLKYQQKDEIVSKSGAVTLPE